VGRYDGEPDPGLVRLADLFNAAGFETKLIDGDVREPIWRKLLANSSVNAVAALTGLTGREIQEIEPAANLVRALARETAAVARAQGLDFAELDAPGDYVIKTLDWVGDNKVSMLQDLEAGRRTEVDNLQLAVVERGERYGVDTPLNWVLGSLIQTREQKMLRDSRARAIAPSEAARPEVVAASSQAARPEVVAAPSEASALMNAALAPGILRRFRG
jgi:2-dehydropantoate 2-reductase